MVNWEKLKRIHKKRNSLLTLEHLTEEIKMENIKELNIVLFSEKEASRILNVSYNKLRYMRQSKLISYCRVGHAIKYRASDLRAFVENNSVAVGV
jgi:hypothetical protein